MAPPTALICALSVASFEPSSEGRIPLLVRNPPPRPGAGNSFKLGSLEVMLVWKSSKLIEGRKSKELAACSGSSVALGAIDPKLKREELLMEAFLARDSGLLFEVDANVELLDECGGFSLSSPGMEVNRSGLVKKCVDGPGHTVLTE